MICGVRSHSPILYIDPGSARSGDRCTHTLSRCQSPRNASVDALVQRYEHGERSPAPDPPPVPRAQCGRNSHLHWVLALPSCPFIRSARARGGVTGEEGGGRATRRPRCSVCYAAHAVAGARRVPNSSLATASSFLRNHSSRRYMHRVPLDLSTTAGLQAGGVAHRSAAEWVWEWAAFGDG